MNKLTALFLSLTLVFAAPAAQAGLLKKLAVVGGLVVAGKAVAKKVAEKKQDNARKNGNGQRQGNN